MNFPSKYLSLIDICLEKRKKINGFFTAFELTMEDFDNTSIASQDELASMLQIIKEDKVRVADNVEPVMEKYTVSPTKITIIACPTDRLLAYRKVVTSSMVESFLKIEEHGDEKTYVHYLGKPAPQPIKGAHVIILGALIEDFRNTVSFYKIPILLRRARCVEPDEDVSPKSIHNMVDKLKGNLARWFPKLPNDAIVPIRGKGYQLVT